MNEIKCTVYWADGTNDTYHLSQAQIDNLEATPAVKEVKKWENK